MEINRTHSSPNHSSRHGADISMIVLHATVGSAKGSLEWLCSKASQVSTHYLIDKKGAIFQLVPDDFAAWHAGDSTWRGRDRIAIQQQSIGIELENLAGVKLKNDAGKIYTHGPDPYPPTQMDAAIWLTRTLAVKYAVILDDVVRHMDIAPGRKSDPAFFDWSGFRLQLTLPQSGANWRAATYAWLRKAPNTQGAPIGEVQQGEPLVVLRELGGELVKRGAIQSDDWLETTEGYLWKPSAQQVGI